MSVEAAAERITAGQIVLVLSATGPLSVNDLAQHMGVLPEALYGPLIAAEGRRLVRVNVHHRSDHRHRTWEAMVTA